MPTRKRKKVTQPNRLVVRHDPLVLTKAGKCVYKAWHANIFETMRAAVDGEDPARNYNLDHIFEIIADALQQAYEDVGDLEND